MDRREVQGLRAAVGARIVGQAEVIDLLILALLSDGHALLEGLPGLAKTRSVKALARALGTELKRVQFTPDLLPSDVTGSVVYHSDEQGGRFRFEQGPIFGNVVLIDEINRAPAKVQSALLEAMEERQVTVGGETHPLPKPFFVLATQNPIEQEGTYPLPEAQLDRFLLHVHVGYPNAEEELAIVRMVRGEELAEPALKTVPLDVITEARRRRERGGESLRNRRALHRRNRDRDSRAGRARRHARQADRSRRLAARVAGTRQGLARARLARRARLRNGR